MIKITQNKESQNFVVSVSTDNIRETVKISSAVSRILAKSGVVSTSTKNGVVTVELISYDDNVSADDVLWALVDSFNVGPGYWDYLGIYIESDNDNGTIQTNKDGSTIKINHKNAYKLREDKEFPFFFAGGLQYFNVFKDSVRIDFPGSHESALQIYNDLQDLLDSLD